MFYNFPVIYTFMDVEYAIRDDENFSIKEKDGFIVVDYILSMQDTFPPITSINDALRRECRGLIFDASTKRIVRRPYHKFFNLGERPETSTVSMNAGSMMVLDKLDGSMIAPFTKGESYVIHWGTRAGVTDVADQAKRYILEHRRTSYYETVASMLMAMGFTPIFEWCSPYNRIVLAYEPSLILTAIRNMVTGEYLSYNNLKRWGRIGNFPVVSEMPYSKIETIRDETDTEGIVARFHNGHMLKVKSSWYVALHKTKEELQYEKDVIRILLDGMKDDLYPFLQPDLQQKLNVFEIDFWKGIDLFVSEVQEAFEKIGDMSRKDFAISQKDAVDPVIMSIIFSTWDSRSYQFIREKTLKIIRKNLSTQTTVNKVRCLWSNNARWSY